MLTVFGLDYYFHVPIHVHVALYDFFLAVRIVMKANSEQRFISRNNVFASRYNMYKLDRYSRYLELLFNTTQFWLLNYNVGIRLSCEWINCEHVQNGWRNSTRFTRIPIEIYYSMEFLLWLYWCHKVLNTHCIKLLIIYTYHMYDVIQQKIHLFSKRCLMLTDV